MDIDRHQTHRSSRILWSVLAGGACLTVAVLPVRAEDRQSGAPVQAAPEAVAQPTSSPAQTPSGAAGMTIYIDPKTGALRQDPAPGTVPLPLTPQLQNALSTSHEGLIQVPSTVPGGGVEIDLQGRFQSPLIATIDADGKLRMQHLHTMPTSGDPHETDAAPQGGQDK